MNWNQFIKKFRKVLNKKEQKELDELLDKVKKGKAIFRWDIKPEYKLEWKDGEYRVYQHEWQGQIVIRNVPNKEYLLYIKMGNRIRSWRFDLDITKYAPAWAFYDGTISSKWWDWEGCIYPRKKDKVRKKDLKRCENKPKRKNIHYNPTEELMVFRTLISKGKLKYAIVKENDREFIFLDVKTGKFKGKYLLSQEEEGSEVYYLETITQFEESSKFEYRLSTDGEVSILFLEYYDGYITFIINGDLIQLVDYEDELEAMKYYTKDKTIKIKNKEFKIVDKGDAIVFIDNEAFCKFMLNGKYLRNYYIASFLDDIWIIMLMKHVGDAFEDIKPYKEPKIIKVRNHPEWFGIELYDGRLFTKSESDYKKYMDIEPIDGLIAIYLGQYPVEGTLPHLKVWRLIFDRNKISEEEAIKWVKEQKFVDMDFIQKKEKHK